MRTKLFIGIFILLAAYVGAVEDSSGCVVLGDKTLFCLDQPEGDLSPIERAKIATQAIERIMADPDIPVDSIARQQTDSSFVIEYKSEYEYLKIVEITAADTAGTGKSMPDLSEDWYWSIRRAIASERVRSLTAGNILKLIIGVLFPVLIILAYIIINRFYKALSRAVVKREGTAFRGIKFRGVEFIPARLQISLILKFLLVVKWVLFFLILYAMFLLFFNLFPATRSYAEAILHTSLNWLRTIGVVLIDLAKFLAIGIILFIAARLLWGLTDLVFRHYESSPDTIRIPETALPVLRRLTKALIGFLFLIGLVAAIPGEGYYISLAIILIACVFLGIASLPFIQSGLSGLALVLFKQLKQGDEIAIGEIEGKISAVGFIWTRVEIENRGELVVLNKYVLSHPFAVISQKESPEKPDMGSGESNVEEPHA